MIRGGEHVALLNEPADSFYGVISDKFEAKGLLNVVPTA